MKTRNVEMLFLAGIVCLGCTFASKADAKVTELRCTVTSVGWREDGKALRVICGGKMFWNPEAVANSTCGLKTTMDAIKLFQATANASLLSGKTVQIFYDTQKTCNTSDPVIREMYLW